MMYPKCGGEEIERIDEEPSMRDKMKDKCIWWDDCWSSKCPCEDKKLPSDSGQLLISDFVKKEAESSNTKLPMR